MSFAKITAIIAVAGLLASSTVSAFASSAENAKARPALVLMKKKPSSHNFSPSPSHVAANKWCDPHYCKDNTDCTSSESGCGTCWAGTCGGSGQ